MAGGELAAATLHELVQRGAHQDGAHLPRGNHGAAHQRRRRHRYGICRPDGRNVCQGPFLLHVHERQRRLAGLVLPTAQRDTGQRFQLYARCRRRIDRFEVGAHHQPEPLRAAGHARGTPLRGIPGQHRGPRAQSAAGLQRQSAEYARQGHVAALRRGLHQHTPPVPHRRRERYGRSRREPRHDHQRQ